MDEPESNGTGVGMIKRFPVQSCKPIDTRMFSENLTYSRGTSWKWLGGLAEKFLKRIGWLKNDWFTSTTFETISFNPEHVLEFVHTQLSDLMRRYNMQDGTIIIGGQDFAKVSKAILNTPFQYNTEIYDQHRRHICGLKVCVIPWMEGIVIVPQELLPIKEVKIKTNIKEFTDAELQLECLAREEE